MNQHALARSDLGGAVQHLVRRDVIQHEADRLGGVQPGRHRNQLTLRQAYELRVRAADRERGHYLAWFDSRDAVAEPIHRAHQIPPRREGQRGRLRMNALAHHQVGQGDARGQHFDSRFAALRLRALFFKHPKCIGPAVVHDDDARVLHIGCVRPVSARATRCLPSVLKFTPSTSPSRSDFSHRSPRTRRLRQGPVSNDRLSPDQQMPNPGRWPRRCLVGRSGRRHRFRAIAIFGLYIAGGWLFPGRKRVVPYSIQWLKRVRPAVFRQDLMALFDLLQQRKIKPLIAQRFPLAEARHAQEMLGDGGVTGKIVLVRNGSSPESGAA